MLRDQKEGLSLRSGLVIERDESLASEMMDFAQDVSDSLSWLVPGIDDAADCLESALEAASFFDDAGMARHLFFGVLSTTETCDPRPTVITPHYWLEVPLGDGKLFVDLTLPHWLTSPDSDETDFDIQTVLTDIDSDALGRRYEGHEVAFPELCGTEDSGHFMDHPMHLRFSEGLKARYRHLSRLVEA